MNAVVEAWYRGSGWLALLAPLERLFIAAVRRRRHAYQTGARASWRAPVPVIVVGNITVGGTGKTPLVTSLVEHLRIAGYRPGIISRGYGGKAPHYPLRVQPDSAPAHAGDEPVMLAQLTGCPVYVAPDRPQAARRLLAETECDLIISDDGLQHYALARDIEIVVIDGARGLGNGRCLPAGPLREPPARLQEVDFVVVNGAQPAAAPVEGERMRIEPAAWRQLATQQRHAVSERPFGTRVHAVAGIGHPARFFATLRQLGLEVIEHPYPDHHRFTPEDIRFDDGLPVVMTAKDAVKCQAFADERHWCLTIQAELSNTLIARLLAQLRSQREDSRHG